MNEIGGISQNPHNLSKEASELHRLLLFCGYEEVTDFLKNSPLNRHLYKLFLDLLPKHQIEVPMVKLFNEIYFQCIRVNYDATPGVEIGGRYLTEEEIWLKSESATQLVFSIVWALLCNKQKFTFEETCFLQQLAPYIQSSIFKELALTLPKDFEHLNISVPEYFPPTSCTVEGLPDLCLKEDNPSSFTWLIKKTLLDDEELYNERIKEFESYSKSWDTVTCHFSHSLIEKYVALYTNPEDQVKLVERIQNACTGEDLLMHTAYFRDLTARITTGKFEPECIPATYPGVPDGFTPDEWDDYRYNLALANAIDDEDSDEIERLKEKCESLESQLEEQKKNHELELARLEAKYQSEIETLNNQKSYTKRKDIQSVASEKASFTVEEMAAYVVEKYDLNGAKEFATMCYRLFTRHHEQIDDRTADLLDGLEGIIRKRDIQITKVNIETVHQMNTSPHQVNNHFKEGKE